MSSPRKDPSLSIDPPLEGWCTVYQQCRGRYFRIGVSEANFLASLDGSRTTTSLVERPSEPFTSEQIEKILHWFEDQGLLEDPAKIVRPPRISWGFLSLRIRLCNPDSLLDRITPVLKLLLSPLALILYLLFALTPLAIACARPHAAHYAASNYTVHFTPQTLTTLYLFVFFLNVLHESAHAAVCKRFGGNVPGIGLMLFYFSPAMYCDISSSWRFRNKRQKIGVALAGIGVQIIVAALTLSGWLLTGHPLWLTLTLLNLSLAAFNLFPFVKLDGYWVLVHMLNEPNLVMVGKKAVDRRIQTWLLKSEETERRDDNSLFWFGFFHLLSVPLFWTLGIYGAYHLVSFISVRTAGAVLLFCPLFLLFKAVTRGSRYLKSLRSSAPI